MCPLTNGKTALYLASQIGHTTTVGTTLLGAGADVNSSDNDGRTALIWASHNVREWRSAKDAIRTQEGRCEVGDVNGSGIGGKDAIGGRR